jgi:hypothetical protein
MMSIPSLAAMVAPDFSVRERPALNSPETFFSASSPLWSELNSAEIQVLKDQHKALWAFYVFVSRRLAEDLERAAEVCQEAIGLPNELPREMRGRML